MGPQAAALAPSWGQAAGRASAGQEALPRSCRCWKYKKTSEKGVKGNRAMATYRVGYGQPEFLAGFFHVASLLIENNGN